MVVKGNSRKELTMTTIYFIETHYFEDYYHDAKSWKDAYFKMKWGTSYILHGFDSKIQAMAFVKLELCLPTEFPNLETIKEYPAGTEQKIIERYSEAFRPEVIDLNEWLKKGINDGYYN